ncbi:unnamed protein product [Cunninghamella blakesleeana]
MDRSSKYTKTSPQADFTAIPPSRKNAPWQKVTESPIGEDAWNHSKQSREHPQLFSTAHGTTDRIEQMEELQEQEAFTNIASSSLPTSFLDTKKIPDDQATSSPSSHRRSSYTECGGHTVRSKPNPRSIKRDLNNI